jgi:hypothetical protein
MDSYLRSHRHCECQVCEGQREWHTKLIKRRLRIVSDAGPSSALPSLRPDTQHGKVRTALINMAVVAEQIAARVTFMS